MDEVDYDPFEDEFADELEALGDVGADGGLFSPTCKPKRSLNFATPSGKQSAVLNSSVIEPLSDSENNNASEKSDVAVDVAASETEDVRKRRTSSDDALLASHASKRQKIDQNNPNPFLEIDAADFEDDWDVTPPGSPKLVPKPRPVVPHPMDVINDRLMRDYDYGRPRVVRRIPTADFVSVTAEDGRRFYMGVQTEMQRVLKAREKFDSAKSADLLSVPFQELKQQVLNQRRTSLEKSTEDVIMGLGDTDDNEEVHDDKVLWVERYTPKGYVHLLSDESTNRTLLHWLKLWDHVVFGRELKKKLPKKDMKKNEKFQKKDLRKEQLEQEMELDSLNRPFHKVVLLCGNPGLGKTTLAHVLAQHAGYKVIEINASDDRSAETFKNKIESAIQMKAVMGADPRPNCLVIDEIDGAPQPAINQLLALIKGGAEGDEKKGGKKKQPPLMRPIICICNDQYAPSLRQLRMMALLLNFPPTMAVKLAGRLLDICQREGLKADQSTLLALCNKTDNDIRACINTLQFFRGKKSNLMLRDVQSASFAQKDAQKGLFAVWQAIFQRPKQNKRQYVNPYDRAGMDIQEMTKLQEQQNNTSRTARFYNIHNLASTAGEYDKVMMGMFENFLNQNIRDPRMDGINSASSWLCHVDLMNSRIARTQDYSTYAYIPYAMVVFHLLFAVNQVNRLQFPHADADYRQKMSTAHALVTSLMEEMCIGVRHYVNERAVVLDVLPPLMDIIQPSFRPINTQLYSAREKADLRQLIHVMVEYNLTYRQDKAPDGHYTYVLEPQVDQIVKFPGLKQRKQMTYAAKQLVAREIDLEKMRRAELPPVDTPTNTAKPSSTAQQQAQKKTNVIPNHKKKLEPTKTLDEKDLLLMSKDFFGRKIDTTSVPTVQTTKKSSDDSSNLLIRDLWYHHKDGFINAVRKTVRIQDML